MTHDHTPDASAQAVRMSLQQWIRVEIGKGHPARLVHDVIEQEADLIRLQRAGRGWQKYPLRYR